LKIGHLEPFTDLLSELLPPYSSNSKNIFAAMIGFTAGFALLQTEGQHGNKARPEEISGGRYEAQNQNSRRQDPTQPQRLGSSDGRIGADLREHGSRHPYRFDECAVIEIPRTARPGADAAS